ncbi:MAG: winged helix-turn-helix domain-containing protein, partial [Bacteroides sp.]
MDLHLSASDLLELKKIQRNVAGTPCYVKVTCVLMLSQGLSPKIVSNSLGIDTSTVYRYLNIYTCDGLDSLLETGHKGYWGMLDSHQLSALREELKFHVYTDAKSISKWVESAFGVCYTPQGIVDLLNRIGFTYKKTKEVP